MRALLIRLRGYRYMVLHVDTATGAHRSYPARSWPDACEWLACALPEDAAHIRTWTGRTVAARRPTFARRLAHLFT